MGLELLTVSETIEKRRFPAHRCACNPVCNPTHTLKYISYDFR